MEHLLTLLLISLFHINGHVCMDIIGGKEAAPHSRPYMALIDRKCGGALINPKWIVTAAHCNFGSNSHAILGAHRLNDTHGQQTIRVKRAIKHPDYHRPSKNNDIQLLQLEKPAKLNKFVKVIELPKREKKISAKKMCSVAGWGVSDLIKRSQSHVLREVDLMVVDLEVCKKKYMELKQVITNNMTCAGPQKKQEGPCMGDSGGPLICDKKYAGVVSFGPKTCGDPEFPGVYTRLTEKYLKWIRTTIGKYYYKTYTI